MNIKLVITNENDVVVSQIIKSEGSFEKDGIDFIINLHEYIKLFVREFDRTNESKLKKMEVFDENDVKLTEVNKNY